MKGRNVVQLFRAKSESAENIFDQVKMLANDSSNVRCSVHAKKAMKRQGIHIIDVFRCLIKGHLTREPELNTIGSWEFDMTVFSAGKGIELMVILEMDENTGNRYLEVMPYLN